MKTLNLTSIGASHIRSGKECQDFSLSSSTDDCSLAITCDGHGGDNYFRSALGSQFAAQAASACITELMFDVGKGYRPSNPEDMLVQLEKSIIARWNAAVWEHYESHPFTQEELDSISESRRKKLQAGRYIESTYGTTLIALALTKDFWFGVQIGDGKCVRIKSDGSFDMPIPPNDKCFLNSTTSICDENAIEDFRHCYSEEQPIALFCGSDGIDDSFIKDEQLYKLYETIARSFAKSEYDQAKLELEDYMPRLSSKGSGDDVSIAGIIDTDHVIGAIGEEPEPEPRVWTCPSCGAIVTTNFCGECGTRKPESQAPESEPEPEAAPQQEPALEQPKKPVSASQGKPSIPLEEPVQAAPEEFPAVPEESEQAHSEEPPATPEEAAEARPDLRSAIPPVKPEPDPVKIEVPEIDLESVVEIPVSIVPEEEAGVYRIPIERPDDKPTAEPPDAVEEPAAGEDVNGV